MLLVDGAGFLAVHPDQHLFAGSQGEDHPLALQGFRDGDTGAEPAVFPFFAPFGTHGGGGEGEAEGLLRCQMVHDTAEGKVAAAPGAEIMLFKCFLPDLQPV